MKDPKISVTINSSCSPKCIQVSINAKDYSWACPEISKDKENWFIQVISSHFLRLYKQARQETIENIRYELFMLKDLLK